MQTGAASPGEGTRRPRPLAPPRWRDQRPLLAKFNRQQLAKQRCVEPWGQAGEARSLVLPVRLGVELGFRGPSRAPCLPCLNLAARLQASPLFLWVVRLTVVLQEQSSEAPLCSPGLHGPQVPRPALSLHMLSLLLGLLLRSVPFPAVLPFSLL